MQRINLKLTGVFLASLALVLSIWFGLNLREQKLRTAAIGQFMTGPYQSSDQRRAQFKRFEETWGKHSTIEGARAKLGTRFANVKLPDKSKLHDKSLKIAALTKNLIGVYLLPEDEGTTTINEIVVYFAPEKSQKDIDRGIDPRAAVAFTVESAELPDFAGGVDRTTQAKAEGSSRGDQPWMTLEVNDNPGMGVEPGYNVIGDTKIPRTGFVDWWEDGFLYHIVGSEGPDGTSMETMLEIAKEIAQSEPAQ